MRFFTAILLALLILLHKTVQTLFNDKFAFLMKSFSKTTYHPTDAKNEQQKRP